MDNESENFASDHANDMFTIKSGRNNLLVGWMFWIALPDDLPGKGNNCYISESPLRTIAILESIFEGQTAGIHLDRRTIESLDKLLVELRSNILWTCVISYLVRLNEPSWKNRSNADILDDRLRLTIYRFVSRWSIRRSESVYDRGLSFIDGHYQIEQSPRLRLTSTQELDVPLGVLTMPLAIIRDAKKLSFRYYHSDRWRPASILPRILDSHFLNNMTEFAILNLKRFVYRTRNDELCVIDDKGEHSVLLRHCTQLVSRENGTFAVANIDNYGAVYLVSHEEPHLELIIEVAATIKRCDFNSHNRLLALLYEHEDISQLALLPLKTMVAGVQTLMAGMDHLYFDGASSVVVSKSIGEPFERLSYSVTCDLTSTRLTYLNHAKTEIRRENVVLAGKPLCYFDNSLWRHCRLTERIDNVVAFTEFALLGYPDSVEDLRLVK